MTVFYATEIGTAKGAGRVWLEGEKLSGNDFTPSATYKRIFKNGVLMMIKSDEGTHKVSGRKASENRITPIIDICNKEVETWFPIGTKVCAIIRKGKIIIRRAAQAVKRTTRTARFLQKVLANKALNVVSMFAGGGVMDRAIHEGMRMGGVNTRTSVVAELSSKFLDANIRANGHLFDENTLFFNGPVQDFDLGKVEQAEIFCAGIPCTGASTAGRAKLHTKSAEAHPEAGAMFFTTMDWVRKFQPSIVILENVKAYQSTASMDVIRSLLGSWEYEVHEIILNGVEYGSLENRNRLVVIGISKGLSDTGFNVETILPTAVKPATIGEILEPIGDDDSRWREFGYLARKETSDISKRKGFRRQRYNKDAPYVNTIVKEYARVQSTNPYLIHPTNPDLTRLFTEIEHGRIKCVPEGFVEALDVSRTTAHKILGQSVIYPVFVAVGVAIGQFIAAATMSREESAQMAFAA